MLIVSKKYDVDLKRVLKKEHLRKSQNLFSRGKLYFVRRCYLIVVVDGFLFVRFFLFTMANLCNRIKPL